MGKTATTGERTVLEDHRMQLQAQIDAFHHKVETIVGEYVDNFLAVESAESDDNDQNWYEDEDDNDETIGEWPEDTILVMPLTFGIKQCQDQGLQDLVDQEMKLQTGQANDCLEKLRVALGHKMILFRTRVQNSTSHRTRT
jgi:hypothetical protein